MTSGEKRSSERVSGTREDAAALRERAQLAGAERGRRQEAVDLWRRYLVVVGSSGTGEALLELGRALVEARREEEAVDVLRRCTEEWPDCFDAYGLLGEVLRQTGDLEAAVGALERAVALRPDDVQPKVSLVICLDALGRRPEAEKALASLGERGANNPAIRALVQELLQRRE